MFKKIDIRPSAFSFQLFANNLFVFFFIFGSFFAGYSQKKELQKAEEAFRDKNFLEAINLYQNIYGKKQEREIALKLADAYYFHENYAQAQRYYSIYFKDSIYENISQFVNYAKSSKLTGKVFLTERLYYKIYENNNDEVAKSNYENYKFYVDTIQKMKSFNLDSNYNCIELDASDSFDPLAAPLSYVWTFEDGKSKEGMKFEHCFDKSGENKIVLSIRDKATGLVKQNDTTVLVYISEPPVKFTSPKYGKQFISVDFDASATQLYAHDIIEYIWDFGNGDSNIGAKVKYKYNVLGSYNVKLTVIAKNKYSFKTEIFSIYRIFEVFDNYKTPSKTFKDMMNEAK